MNPYLLLAVLAAVAELAFGGMSLVLGLRGARSREDADRRLPLLGLVSGRQALVALVSAPLVLLFLGSQVSEWKGVMCIQGILNLGDEARGLAAGLPALLTVVFLTKALALAAGGGAWTLRRIDDRTRTAPLARAAAAALAASGAFAAVDGGALLAWIAVPKAGQPLAAGCCMAIPSMGGSGPTSDAARTGWTVAFLGSAGLAAALGIVLARRPALPAWRSFVWPLTALTGLAVTGTGARFLQTALAPARLRRPLHECAFCLLDEAPSLWIGVAAALACTACLAWAWLAAWGAGTEDAAMAAVAVARGLLVTASLGALVAAGVAVFQRWVA